VDCRLISRKSRGYSKKNLTEESGRRVIFRGSSRTFVQNDLETKDLGRPPGRSDGREKLMTWPAFLVFLCARSDMFCDKKKL